MNFKVMQAQVNVIELWLLIPDIIIMILIYYC